MFGSFAQGIHEYARIGLETGVVAASPHGLIVMLYEGAISSCQTAIQAMQQGEIEKKGQAISKAIMIIESGLRVSLDKKSGGAIAESLDALYQYMSNQLYKAHVKNNAEPIHEVIKLMTDIKEAWVAIASIEAKNNLALAPNKETIGQAYSLG